MILTNQNIAGQYEPRWPKGRDIVMQPPSSLSPILISGLTRSMSTNKCWTFPRFVKVGTCEIVEGSSSRNSWLCFFQGTSWCLRCQFSFVRIGSSSCLNNSRASNSCCGFLTCIFTCMDLVVITCEYQSSSAFQWCYLPIREFVLLDRLNFAGALDYWIARIDVLLSLTTSSKQLASLAEIYGAYTG